MDLPTRGTVGISVWTVKAPVSGSGLFSLPGQTGMWGIASQEYGLEYDFSYTICSSRVVWMPKIFDWLYRETGCQVIVYSQTDNMMCRYPPKIHQINGLNDNIHSLHNSSTYVPVTNRGNDTS